MTNADTAAPVSRAVLPLLLACATLTVMAGATISPSLPDLLDHFRETPDAATLVPLILTAPGAAIALSAPLSGLLVDRSDPRRVLLAGIVLYILAGTSGLYLSGLGQILVGRVLLGLAVGAIMTASTTLIAHFFAGQERAKVLGFQASAMGFGGVIFIMAGGLLADLSWRAPFAVYLAPLLLLPLVIRTLPPVDRSGTIAAEPGASDRFPIRLAAGIYALTFLNMLIFYMVPTQLPFLIRALGAENASTAGMTIALIMLSSALLSLSFGRIRAKLHSISIAALSFIGIGLSFVAISQAQSLMAIILIAPVLGISLGAMMPSLSTWLLSRVPAPMRGRANGMFTMSVFSAQFLSAFVGSALVHQGGLRMAFWPMGLLALLPALTLSVIALIRTKRLA